MSVHLSSVLVIVTFFVVYVSMWSAMRRRCKKEFSIDPNVMGHATDPLQKFMFSVMRLISLASVAIIFVHAFFMGSHPWLTRIKLVPPQTGLALGATSGLCGLLLCAIAQQNMGASWRVGIDEKQSTPLVTTGIHGLIRNPTYTGLGLVFLGLWLVWPTAVVTMFGIACVFFFEVQVRCEERDLEQRFGGVYAEYVKKTTRYIPGVY